MLFSTVSENHIALSIYKKLGFTVEGVRKNDLKYSDEKYIDTVLMGIKINE